MSDDFDSLDHIIMNDLINLWEVSSTGAQQFMEAQIVTDADDRKALRRAVRHTLSGHLRGPGARGKGH